MTTVEELSAIFKKTDFIKVCPPLPNFWDMPAPVHDRLGRRVSKINEGKKHSQKKVKNSDRFVHLYLGKQVARQTPLTLGTLVHFRHL